MIREAVTEMEATWTKQLGPRRFAQLRDLLLDLNQPVPELAVAGTGSRC